MKRPSEEAIRVLTLLKLDAQRLFERIEYRRPEYIQIFSVKRTREHFPKIFKNRYDEVKLSELKSCSPEVIVGLDNFYSKVDELSWYLGVTEDMPITVEEKIKSFIGELKVLHQVLQTHINAELNII